MPPPSDPEPTRPAVFLDRDGTIIEDVGCLDAPEKIRLLPGAAEALAELGRVFRLFIVTHQVWIARGLLTNEAVDAIHAALAERLAPAGVRFDAVYVCPHERADNCLCLKPRPHLLHEAAREFRVDLARSWSVGDHPHDAALAPAAGGRGVYVLTGHGAKHRHELDTSVPVAEDLAGAARYILAHRNV
jgi:D-glycero-D-manno-heptose 1,7-bisphosphate phosphatase